MTMISAMMLITKYSFNGNTDSRFRYSLLATLLGKIVNFHSQRQDWAWLRLIRRPYHLPNPTSQQKIALMEKQMDLLSMKTAKLANCVTQNLMLHPGLPFTTTLQSLSKGSSFSTELIAVGSEQKTCRFAFQTNFQVLAPRCSLVAPSLVVLMDPPPMGNT